MASSGATLGGELSPVSTRGSGNGVVIGLATPKDGRGVVGVFSPTGRFPNAFTTTCLPFCPAEERACVCELGAKI